MRRLSLQALRRGIPVQTRCGDKLQLRKNGPFELYARPMDRLFNYTEGNHATRLQAWAFCTAAPTGGVIEVPLAQTGEGIADCELLKWFVQEGDQVDEFQPLCQVQSDKATIDITSRYKGKVSKVNAMPGAVVKVGETLLELITTTGYQPQNDENSSAKNVDKVLATPAVRNLAKELGINLASVSGTGQDGRVLKEDVLNLASAKQGIEEDISSISVPPPAEPSQTKSSDSEEKVVKSRWSAPPPLQEDEVIPLRGFRRTMAKSMTAAAAVPHFHYMDEITMDSLVELKASLQAQSTSKLTYLPFLIKALSLSLQKHRLMNSTVNQDASVITSKACHNIGVAMATTGGLVVPNIKQVQNLSVFEIAEEISRLSDLASKNKLSPTDVTDGTITISNFGAIGGKFGSPVLNIPEVSIVAIGRIQQLPRFNSEGRVYAASIASITCGADHRVIDGASVASFCNQWKFLVENPHQWLLHLR